jgi:transcriptional regulator with XRE-family HTH domain
MKIKNLVKNYRKHLGYTQSQFAEKFDTTANTVSRWENGMYEVPNLVLEKVLSEFGVIEVICPLCMGSGMYKKIGDSHA